MFPLIRVPFWYQFFEPQPYGRGSGPEGNSPFLEVRNKQKVLAKPKNRLAVWMVENTTMPSPQVQNPIPWSVLRAVRITEASKTVGNFVRR